MSRMKRDTKYESLALSPMSRPQSAKAVMLS